MENCQGVYGKAADWENEDFQGQVEGFRKETGKLGMGGGGDWEGGLGLQLYRIERWPQLPKMS